MRVNGILSVSSFCEVCSAVSQCEKLREWDGIFLRVVDERTNVASSYENHLVCSVC